MTWQKEWITGDGKPIKSGIEVKHVREHLGQIIVGDLALDFTDEGWNIYHVPTGACFDAAVPFAYRDTGLKFTSRENIHEQHQEYSKEQLLAWMAKVQNVVDGCYELLNGRATTGRVINNNWKELSKLTPANYATNGTVAKKIIQEWCLSVKVE